MKQRPFLMAALVLTIGWGAFGSKGNDTGGIIAYSLAQQGVARQDGETLAVHDVQRRLAAPQRVVVHRGEVVVNQGVRVDELDGARRRSRHRLHRGRGRTGAAGSRRSAADAAVEHDRVAAVPGADLQVVAARQDAAEELFLAGSFERVHLPFRFLADECAALFDRGDDGGFNTRGISS